MTRIFVLLLALISAGCMELAEAGQGTYGHRRGPWRRTPLFSDEPNIFDQFRWDIRYESPGATGLLWIPEDPEPTTGNILDTPNVPSINQSTAPLIELPARLTNEGMVAGTTGYTGEGDFPSSNFHYRGLFDLTPAASNGDRIWRYLVSGTRFAELRLLSAVTAQFTVRNDASGGIFTGNVSFPGETGFLLIDWVVSGATMEIYINGTDFSPADHTGAVAFANNIDTLTLLNPAVTTASELGIHVFHAWRFDQSISLPAHQEDATEIGL